MQRVFHCKHRDTSPHFTSIQTTWRREASHTPLVMAAIVIGNNRGVQDKPSALDTNTNTNMQDAHPGGKLVNMLLQYKLQYPGAKLLQCRTAVWDCKNTNSHCAHPYRCNTHSQHASCVQANVPQTLMQSLRCNLPPPNPGIGIHGMHTRPYLANKTVHQWCQHPILNSYLRPSFA